MKIGKNDNPLFVAFVCVVFILFFLAFILISSLFVKY